MTVSTRKNLYIADDVLAHLESQPNQSEYVNRLIREDMNKVRVLTKDDVIKIIDEHMSKYSNIRFLPTSFTNPIEDCKADITKSISSILEGVGS